MFRGLMKWTPVLAAVVVLVTAGPARAQEHKSSKYTVEYVDDLGNETTRGFDLSKPTDAEEFHRLFVSGKISKATIEHLPGIGHLFSLRWDLGLWTLVVFGILLYILSRTAWPAMLDGLKKREQNIADAISSAERARQDSERIQKEMQAQMAQANDEVRALMDEARKDAAAAKESMLEGAKKEIATERDRLRREIDTAKDQALQDIWGQSTQLAALISSKALRREIRPEDHKRFFDEAMADLKDTSRNVSPTGKA